MNIIIIIIIIIRFVKRQNVKRLPWRCVILLLSLHFALSCRRRKIYCGHARLCVRLSVCVCLSVRVSVCLRLYAHTTLLHRPGCNLEEWYGLPPSCALLGGFAIGAWVALLWQHNANPSYKLAPIP